MSALKLVSAAPDAGQTQTADEARRLVRMAAALVIALVGGLGLWSVLATLQGAVVAGGLTKVEANVKPVQPADGGVVRVIHVVEGARVRAGDPILELEDVEAHAALQTVREELDASLARQARLVAEMRGSARLAFPPELTSRSAEARVRSVMANEQELFDARRNVIALQATQLRAQARAIEAQIRSNEAQVAAADRSLGYLHQQEKMSETLHEQRFVSSARLLDARRSTAEKEEKKFEFEALTANARQRLADIELRLSNLRTAQIAEATKDLTDNETRVQGLRERLKPAREAVNRRIVRAPASGTVNVLRMHTVGGVVAPRETVAEIVPDAASVVAEVRVNPADIEEVRVGQDVEIELSGFNRRVVPLLRGKVVFVSPEAQTDPAAPGLRYFTARATFTQTPPAGVALTPGLPVTVYMETASRSPLELWLDPVLGAMRRALRES